MNAQTAPPRAHFLAELEQFMIANGFTKESPLKEVPLEDSLPTKISFIRTLQQPSRGRQIIYQNGQAYEVGGTPVSRRLRLIFEGPNEVSDIIPSEDTTERFDIVYFELDGDNLGSISVSHTRFPEEFIADYQMILGRVI